MWRPPINFITLHYAYIVSYGIMAIAILYPAGNLRAVDAYFFGVSASTESGLNPVDVKDLKLYQQFFLYFVPIVTNMGFVNIIVVIIRLRYFSQRFKKFANKRARITRPNSAVQGRKSVDLPNARDLEQGLTGETIQPTSDEKEKSAVDVDQTVKDSAPRITFAPEPRRDEDSKYPLHIPGPRERENGQPIVPLSDNDEDEIKPVNTMPEGSEAMRRRRLDTVKMSKATSIDRAVSSVFVLGSTSGRLSRTTSRASRVSIDLSTLTPEELGGIEYRALRILLKITIGYYFSLHFIGILCLVPWIHRAPHKYQEVLGSQGINKTWWGFYSAQTMVNNLGFTLTPDSMVSFRDATWPMLVLSFLAYAGHTFYPVFLRLVIWTIYKIVPEESSMKESLLFLLDHPRRCYTLLFPSIATWTLAGILIALNFVDVLLIVCLDLDNPEVNVLPPGPRILAAIFQAASSRHTGTASFNLGNVNPAVQFSLLVMMYISIYPIAISVRMSTDYQEQPVGIFSSGEHSIDETSGSGSYLINHMRNQLSFDLWYIFLGVFCICCAESKRIMNREDYAFSVFSIFFEVVSAYANVGLSLGYPTNATSLCGHFTVFGKLTICAMMIRGRHRGLPYAIDRAIMLPVDHRIPDYDYLNRTQSKEEQKFQQEEKKVQPESNPHDQDNTTGSKSKEA